MKMKMMKRRLKNERNMKKTDEEDGADETRVKKLVAKTG